MLVAVVSIFAFAMGVVVGRDAPNAAGGAVGGPAAASPDAPADPPRLVLLGEPEEEPTAGALDEVTYPHRLGSDGPPEEKLRGLPLYARGSPERTPDPGPAAVPHAEAAPEELEQKADEPGGTVAAETAASVAGGEATSVAPPPAGDPYTVQVAALRSADAAAELAGRLLEKGFPAYVVEPAPDGPEAVYRVRVGKYADHDEAERVRQRLEQEEQLTAWITR